MDRRRRMTQPRCLRVPWTVGFASSNILICRRTAFSSKVNTRHEGPYCPPLLAASRPARSAGSWAHAQTHPPPGQANVSHCWHKEKASARGEEPGPTWGALCRWGRSETSGQFAKCAGAARRTKKPNEPAELASGNPEATIVFCFSAFTTRGEA
jgi:hypothetical protein